MVRVRTYKATATFTCNGYDPYTKTLRDIKRTIYPDGRSRIVFEFYSQPAPKESYGYQAILEKTTDWAGRSIRRSPRFPEAHNPINNISIDERGNDLMILCDWVEDGEKWATEITAKAISHIDIPDNEAPDPPQNP